MDLTNKNLSYWDNFKYTVMSNYVKFSGRASRSEFWRFTAVYIGINFILQLLQSIMPMFISDVFSFIDTVFWIALILPSLGLYVRRMHDVGKSGWWVLLWLIPIIGWIISIYWLALRGDDMSNAYGDLVSYESITPQMAVEMGLSTTPSESMDQKVMIGSIVIYIITLLLSLSKIKILFALIGAGLLFM